MRPRPILVVVIAVALTVWLGWMATPERRLNRSWEKLLRTVEARHARALGSVLAEDYRDRWGYTKQTLVADARLAFYHFQELEIRTDDVNITRDGDRAVITAMIRVEVRGSDEAQRARVAANALFAPFEFTWQREPDFPWGWKLESFDHPEFDLGRFRRGISGGF